MDILEKEVGTRAVLRLENTQEAKVSVVKKYCSFNGFICYVSEIIQPILI